MKSKWLEHTGMLCFMMLFTMFSMSTNASAADDENTTTENIKNNTINYDFCGEFGWIDDAHCYLNYGVDTTASRLNNWFKREGDDQNSEATTRGRVRFGWEPRSGDLSEFDFRFRIRVKLPALEERVELFFSDEEDDLNQQAVKAARNDELGNRDQTVLALQFKKDEKDKMSYRVGFGRGSQIYTRARYTDNIKLGANTNMRYFAESNFYSTDGLGFEANAELGHVFNENSAYEISNSFRFRDRTNDWIWRHEFQYLYVTDDETSYLFTAAIDGLSKPRYQKEQMLVSVRYKRRFLREWLFIEIEPFILWLREEEFRSSPGIAVRAEIHFQT
ncbi:hypothetical protein [Glaciecola petra]|uniref:Uncharacterized protein n=1 Tax=Glaciecola petra TaxID=3075602 RepID=A0ABU2ZTY0_9ALTE|nr:hypothetical protein [Aestuariibacter sp. P117]MDT0595493.1 hypothetical protein [Aestuariibacter sp. P117]